MNYKSREIYRYNQRVRPPKLPKETEPERIQKQIVEIQQEIDEGEKQIKENTRKIKRFETTVLIVAFLAVVASITLTATMFARVTSSDPQAWGNPIKYAAIYGLICIFYIMQERTRNKHLVAGSVILLVLPIYIYYALGQPFFADLMVITATLYIFSVAKSLKYQDRILLLLFGINAIIASENYLPGENLAVVRNVIFAVATGIIAAGVLQIFNDIQHYSKRKERRATEIEITLLIVESVVETLYCNFQETVNKDDDPDFRFVEYEKFEKELAEYIKKPKAKIAQILDDDLQFELKHLAEEAQRIYDEKRQIIRDKTFTDDEIEEIYRLHIVATRILESIESKQQIQAGGKIIQFLSILRSLEDSFLEFDDLVNRFGKIKDRAMYPVGGGRIKWESTMKPIKAEEIHQNAKRIRKEQRDGST
ncbi:MAG: hypothetical protein FWE38_04935 [Firmicutes bacterium]|nr:hypothetical protein [Bacillota bacterium]